MKIPKGFIFDTIADDTRQLYLVKIVVEYDDNTTEQLNILYFESRQEMYSWVQEQKKKLQP